VVVRHHVFPPDLGELLTRAWNSGGFVVLVEEVPELRRLLLRHRIVLGRPGRLALYASAALALGGRRRASAATLALWAGDHARTLRRSPGSRSERAKALPVVLLADAITAASLVAGSIRARSLVL
jgi:hypothetical protein